MAQELFVSRTAVSKWESGRGYPNIDSLKAISKFFGVTVDELLSGEELLTISEEDSKKRENRFRDLVFALLDLSVVLLAVLPLFGQKAEDMIQCVSLLSLTEVAPYLHVLYMSAVVGMSILGGLTLALQNWEQAVWSRNKNKISLFLNIAGVLLFVISQQPYAATFLLTFLIIKVLMLVKWQ